MITASIGHYSLVGVLILTFSAALTIIWGYLQERKSMVRIGYLLVGTAAVLAVAAAVSLWTALLSDDFRLVYVARQSSIQTPLPYKIGAFWGGQEGSLLLWLLILLIYTAITAWIGLRSDSTLPPLATAVLSLLAAFFALLVSFVADPFATQTAPTDGNGLNPLLQDPFMMMHPLALYAGYVGFAIPYAYCVSALLQRRTDDAWIRTTRRWALLAWGFLSLGILLGGSWAYQELGWGGYWAWDPVENASLMPWLIGTAFIHSVMIQEKRGMLKAWNVILIVSAYLLTLLGTFLTRSGLLISVHSFAQSDIGPWFLGFLGLSLTGSIYLVLNRLDCLKDERRLESYLSKEASFLLNNVVFAAVTFAVAWGTVFPVISRQFGVEVSVGAPYFERVATPFFALILFLMGVGPLIAWRKASWKQLRQQLQVPAIAALLFGVSLVLAGIHSPSVLGGFTLAFFALAAVVFDVTQAAVARFRYGDDSVWALLPNMFGRNPRKYGGYLVHVAVVFIAMGIIGSHSFSRQVDATVMPGQSIDLAGYSLVYQGLRAYEDEGVPVVAADLLVYRQGRPIGTMEPAKRYIPEFVQQQGPYTVIDIRRSLGQDLYVVFAGWDPETMLAGFKVYVNPMVNWIWLGGLLMIYGTLFALWPRPSLAANPEKEWIFKAWSELEYDYRTGKLAEADYRQLRREYTTALQSLEMMEKSRKKALRSRLEAELETQIARMQRWQMTREP